MLEILITIIQKIIYIPPKIEKKLVAISTNQHANQLFRQKMFNHDIKTVMGLGLLFTVILIGISIKYTFQRQMEAG